MWKVSYNNKPHDGHESLLVTTSATPNLWTSTASHTRTFTSLQMMSMLFWAIRHRLTSLRCRLTRKSIPSLRDETWQRLCKATSGTHWQRDRRKAAGSMEKVSFSGAGDVPEKPNRTGPAQFTSEPEATGRAATSSVFPSKHPLGELDILFSVCPLPCPKLHTAPCAPSLLLQPERRRP